MFKPDDPKQLAIDLLARSICSVQVAAVIADSHGIFGWGWNSVGKGLGEHAEAAAIRRSNRTRMHGASIYIVAQRKRNKKIVTARPCEDCFRRINRPPLYDVWYRDGAGIWRCL